MKVAFPAAVLVLVFALPSEAQQLNLQINDGRVTLDAVNVPASQILAEWARIGGTKVVGAEKITGAPLTLKLANVPERQALDIILRNVAGFMAAPRLASAAPGASTYDRILIMATSSVVPSQPAGRNVAPGVTSGTQRRIPPRPPTVIAGDEPPMDDQGNPVHPEDDQADTGIAQQPVFTFPTPPPGMQPGQNGPVFVPMQQNGPFGGAAPGVANPVISLQPNQNGPTIYNFVPGDQPQQPQTPTNPWGVFGSPQPGMIQVPQPQPQQPQPPQRPPGGR